MAQTVTTYNYSKKQNSTKHPTSGGTAHTVVLKDPTSLIHPVFILESFSRLDNYLKWGDRYYFITDIVQRTNDTAEYHCIVDPLASWKTYIGQQTEYIVRAASAGNGNIIDLLYPLMPDTTVEASTLTGGLYDWIGYTLSGTYVMGIISGSSAASGSVAYYAMTASEFQALLNFMFAGTWLDQSETDISLITQKQLVNPFQYIVSCYWFPFPFTSGTAQNIYFGWWDSGLQGLLLGPAQREYSASGSVALPHHPQRSTRGNYLDSAPFTQRELVLYTFGRIPLDPSLFMGSYNNIVCSVWIDIFTGGGHLIVSASDGNNLKRAADAWSQVGIPIQISQITQSLLSPVMSVIEGAVGLVTGNVAGYAGGIGNAIQSMMPQVRTAGSTGSNIDYATVPGVISTFRNQTPMDATHRGKPVCDSQQINSLSGYIQCEDVQVDIPCTQEERDIIQHFMESGFYYE